MFFCVIYYFSLFIYKSFLVLFFLFIVILPVFVCEIIQSHLLYVGCPDGFSLFSFSTRPFFFLWRGRKGGGGTARYKDLNIFSQAR